MSDVALPSSPDHGGAGQAIKSVIKSLLRSLGLKVQKFHPRYDETIRLVRLMQANGVDLVFDVGASTATARRENRFRSPYGQLPSQHSDDGDAPRDHRGRSDPGLV